MSFGALRITISSGVTYDHITLYDRDEWQNMDIPNLFEDEQIVFTHRDGTFVLPDYNVCQIQLAKGKVIPPRDSIMVKRILLQEDLNYPNCYLLEEKHYEQYGIPRLFTPFLQFAWICKDGLFIAPDYQIVYVTM